MGGASLYSSRSRSASPYSDRSRSRSRSPSQDTDLTVPDDCEKKEDDYRTSLAAPFASKKRDYRAREIDTQESEESEEEESEEEEPVVPTMKTFRATKDGGMISRMLKDALRGTSQSDEPFSRDVLQAAHWLLNGKKYAPSESVREIAHKYQRAADNSTWLYDIPCLGRALEDTNRWLQTATVKTASFSGSLILASAMGPVGLLALPAILYAEDQIYQQHDGSRSLVMATKDAVSSATGWVKDTICGRKSQASDGGEATDGTDGKGSEQSQGGSSSSHAADGGEDTKRPATEETRGPRRKRHGGRSETQQHTTQSRRGGKSTQKDDGYETGDTDDAFWPGV